MHRDGKHWCLIVQTQEMFGLGSAPLPCNHSMVEVMAVVEVIAVVRVKAVAAVDAAQEQVSLGGGVGERSYLMLALVV